MRTEALGLLVSTRATSTLTSTVQLCARMLGFHLELHYFIELDRAGTWTWHHVISINRLLRCEGALLHLDL